MYLKIEIAIDINFLLNGLEGRKLDWNIFDKINVLIVDDQEFNRKLIMTFLSPISKIECIEAQNGIEALDKLKMNDIDIILLDLNMPVMNGEETLRHIKEKVMYSLIPIIIVSNKNGLDDFSILNCVDNFLCKPLRADDLETNIYNYMKLRQEKLEFQKSLSSQWTVLKHVNILIVEDDAFNRELMISFLAYNKNLNFIEAENGLEALEALEKYEIDVILLDLHMPKMNGAEAMREIKSNNDYDLIPIIIITSDEKESRNFKILESANDFLLKPIDAPTLESKLYALIKLRIENLQLSELSHETIPSCDIEEEVLSIEKNKKNNEYRFANKTFIEKLEYKLFLYLKSRLDSRL